LREQKVSALFIDQRGGDTGDGAVLFIEEQTGIGEGEGDMTVGGDGRGELDDKEEAVAVVTLERNGLAVGTLHFFDDQVGVQFDADAAGSFNGFEVDLGNRGNGLTDSVDGGGDVVMVGQKRGGAGSLGVQRRGGTREAKQRNEEKCSRNSRTQGHRTPFRCIQFCTNVPI